MNVSISKYIQVCRNIDDHSFNFNGWITSQNVLIALCSIGGGGYDQYDLCVTVVPLWTDVSIRAILIFTQVAALSIVHCIINNEIIILKVHRYRGGKASVIIAL